MIEYPNRAVDTSSPAFERAALPELRGEGSTYMVDGSRLPSGAAVMRFRVSRSSYLRRGHGRSTEQAFCKDQMSKCVGRATEAS